STLCEIWQSVLGLERVGIHDNFFDIGGNSFLLIKALSNMNNSFNTNYNVLTFMQNSTVFELSKKVMEINIHEKEGLVRLDNSSELSQQQAMVIFPGAGLTSASYNFLTDTLKKKFSVYFLESYGINGKHEPHVTLEEIVNIYSSEIESTITSTPIVLFGHSFGGILAFEVAKILETQGHDVQLIICDTLLFAYDNTSTLKPPYDSASSHSMNFLQREESSPNRSLSSSNLRDESHASPTFKYIEAVYERQVNMQRTYKPSGVIKTPMHLVYGEESEIFVDNIDQIEKLYQPYSSALVTSTVKGGHYTMLHPENVNSLIQVLSAISQKSSHEEYAYFE
ncbi:MAG: alpha/beta fold hydrolase, partial [Gammaproteobacteria bacterium]|nr:alpha/beta fold hydrolase [Gammaproteobacteria bacterium]